MPGSSIAEHTYTRSLESARVLTDRLFDTLVEGAIYDRPIPERHRLIFYLGHLEAFDWNQMRSVMPQTAPFHADFDQLFERGIDPPPGQARKDTPTDWPSVEEVRHYGERARAQVDALLPKASNGMRELLIEHRLMHAETLAYLLHQLPYSRKRPGPEPPSSLPPRAEQEMILIPEGRATLGQKAGAFGWDNEFPEHSSLVPAFRCSRFKVTNGEYLEFVQQGAPAPHFWKKSGDGWHYRGMFAEVPLPLDHPVYVMHDEARSYAAWRGSSLLTEEQFHRAAYGTDRGSERLYPWGEEEPSSELGNFNFTEWDPNSVYGQPRGDSAFGVAQLVGNGYEWTSTPFQPFAGFTPMPTYPVYSADFFDEAHFVIKGGSPRTAAELLRRSFRNWFRPNYPYAYVTFRLVEN